MKIRQSQLGALMGVGNVINSSLGPRRVLQVVMDTLIALIATLSGYWEGVDIETRSALGFFPSEESRNAIWAERHREKGGILAALRSEGLLPSGMADDPAQVPMMTTELMESIHQYLARTPASIVLVNIEDVIGTRCQTNLPGTVDQHPN